MALARSATRALAAAGRGLRWAVQIPLIIAVLVASYYATLVVHAPVHLGMATRFGKEICRLARDGTLASVTMHSRFASATGLGPGLAERFRALAPELARECTFRAYLGNFDGPTVDGAIVVYFQATSERYGVSVQLFHHFILSPLADLLLNERYQAALPEIGGYMGGNAPEWREFDDEPM